MPLPLATTEEYSNDSLEDASELEKESIFREAYPDGPTAAGEDGTQGAAKGKSALTACSRTALAAAARGGSLGVLGPDRSEESNSMERGRGR